MRELITVEKNGQLVLIARSIEVDEKIAQMCPWYYVSDDIGIGKSEVVEEKETL